MKVKLTNVINEAAFKTIIGIIFLFILSSCRVHEDWDLGCDVSFLWFIPVSSSSTVIVCVVEIVAFLLGLIGKYAYDKEGVYHKQIKRGIYNNNGEQIGSYDTGEFETWNVTKEDEARSKIQFARVALNLRMKSLIICTCGVILSWFFPFPRIWFWLFFIPVCIMCFRHKFINEDSIPLLLIWEKIFLVICVIAIIVYNN